MARLEELTAEIGSARIEVRPTRAEIDLDAIVHNAKEIRQWVGAGVGLCAVVKADAYGHGAVPVVHALFHHGSVDAVAVSLVEEGIELRRAGVRGPILVMGGVYTGAHREILASDLTPVISDLGDVHALAAAASSFGVRAKVHLKVDTGMARLGVREENLPAFLAELPRVPQVEIVGACTHLASADAEDNLATEDQLARFERMLLALRSEGIFPLVVHAANTAATFRFRAAHYSAVRPGLALYGGGLPPSSVTLRPAMRLVSAIAQLRDVREGDAVSYGALWRAKGRARLATLPIGYADGYPRRLTGNSEVLVLGRRCPVVGAICMDMTVVDVTHLGDQVHVGDQVVLLGSQGNERVTAEELASRAGLIEYEITCGVSKRVPRVAVVRSQAFGGSGEAS
ncbi:MAG: alanine racemase [Deltaproteobacteria bacterium]|nr:alanine racemase [Deltaproteobacteria bacterium]